MNFELNGINPELNYEHQTYLLSCKTWCFGEKTLGNKRKYEGIEIFVSNMAVLVEGQAGIRTRTAHDVMSSAQTRLKFPRFLLIGGNTKNRRGSDPFSFVLSRFFSLKFGRYPDNRHPVGSVGLAVGFVR